MDHLALAERHMVQGKTVIDRQSNLVAQLEREGRDTIEARALLALFHELQSFFEQDHARLEGEFQAVPST